MSERYQRFRDGRNPFEIFSDTYLKLLIATYRLKCELICKEERGDRNAQNSAILYLYICCLVYGFRMQGQQTLLDL